MKKYVSIFGDSISTLSGWNPENYNVFYEGTNCVRSGVREFSDTWWGQLIDHLGAKLLVNDSWSGSRVTKLPHHNQLFPSGISDERINNLRKKRKKPDLIIVMLGYNDWGYGVCAAKQDGCANERNPYVFNDAYDYMLEKLKNTYPKAKIYCCTLFSAYIPNNPDFVFPKIWRGNSIEVFNRIIRDTAARRQCGIIDLHENAINIPTIDGSHPNKDGMKIIADSIAEKMMNITGA